MNNITVTVGAVTYAIKLKKLLSREGIQSKLVKVEDVKGGLGCIHGVQLKQNDFLRAVIIMKKNNIEYTVYQGL